MGAKATIVYDDEEAVATEDVDVGNLEVRDDWVVIAYESADQWIPRERVFRIVVERDEDGGTEASGEVNVSIL
jgi:hypothetical protein